MKCYLQNYLKATVSFKEKNSKKILIMYRQNYVSLNQNFRKCLYYLKKSLEFLITFRMIFKKGL